MKTGRIIALGFFDGVHRGHAALLDRAVAIAKETGLQPAALTFKRHPSAVLTGRSIPLINTLFDRVSLLNHYISTDNVIVLPFDETIRDMDCSSFVDMLCHRFGASHFVCGYDYRFGRGGAGNADTLRRLAQAAGLGCDVVPPVKVDGEALSSTKIRRLVADGDMEGAQKLLGHPHILSGEVVTGRQLGRKLGFPTVNIILDDEVQSPRFGVFAVTVCFDGERHPAVANVGVKPTISDDGQVYVESHIFDYDGDLYGRRVTVEFERFVRAERRFSGVDELRTQVLRDIAEVKAHPSKTP